jgi:hypothetical protein
VDADRSALPADAREDARPRQSFRQRNARFDDEAEAEIDAAPAGRSHAGSDAELTPARFLPPFRSHEPRP